MIEDASGSTSEALAARVEALEAALAQERTRADGERKRADEVTAERDRLREGYRHLQLEIELMRRRLVVAKAERVDTKQLELEFAAKLRELDRLAGLSPEAPADPDVGGAAAANDKKKSKSKGRRRLSELEIPEERIELTDPALEGTTERIGSEDSYKLMWRRAGHVRLVVARVKYKVGDGDAATIATTEVPRELITRSLAAPSLLAHIATDKFCDGLPLHRQEDRFARLGARIDRGTMSRWLEELGGAVGSTVVAAMRADALAHAFCISTDATGVLVQPIQTADKQRRACDRGHFIVQIADRDHVFFEYTRRETGAAIAALFRGFTGFVQADAASVHNILFLPASQRPPPDDDCAPDHGARLEVGCWAHLRRKCWEAAIAKDPVAREGLARIARIFELDRSWRKKSAAEIKALRDAHLRPHTDAFFAWIDIEYDRVRDQRGLLRTALGYAHRQQGPLTRFFDDGRLKLDNNASERELRRIAVGRKNWLFVGSDDHAHAAASGSRPCNRAEAISVRRLPYLRDLFRLLPYWPRERFLELCPRDWLATRVRLAPAELECELGPITVPEPATTSPE